MESQSVIHHKHHIIPRHMGGSDYDWNIAELTIEEHAEAHKRLFEAYGRIEDKWAWKFLAGLAKKDPKLLKEAQKINSKKGYNASLAKMTSEQRKKNGSIGSKRGYNESLAKITPEQRKKISSIGGKAAMAKYTLEERSKFAKEASKAWKLKYYTLEERRKITSKGNKAAAKKLKGAKHYNNGVKSIFCHEKDVPDGFVKGMLKRKPVNRSHV